MPTLDEISFTIAQDAEQHALRTVSMGYAYTIARNADEDGAGTFTVTVDILGDDLLRDDKLALGVDEHEVVCRSGSSERRERHFVVAQSLLDNDIGTDEIKLQIHATDDRGEVVSAMTRIIKGNF